jgi:DNA-directed RNA polymerase subunit D
MVSIKTEGNKSIVEFSGTHNTIVNAFRRVILDEVPTFAIEDVEIVKNDSALYDETLAHRLGLVPLTTDLSAYNVKKDCKCGTVGCALCEVKMSFSQSEIGYVYSGSIKSEDPAVKPAFDTIPLTKLLDGQEIDVNVVAVLGVGRTHAKWAPAHAFMKENGNSVDLVIESFGQLSGNDIFNTSVDVLIGKIEELESKL